MKIMILERIPEVPRERKITANEKLVKSLKKERDDACDMACALGFLYVCAMILIFMIVFITFKRDVSIN